MKWTSALAKGIEDMNELDHSSYNNKSAQTFAGKAVLLEIGANLGLLDPLLSQEEISITEMANNLGIQESLVSSYYSALTHAGLAKACTKISDQVTHYSASSDLQKSINDVGYILWGVMSCAPLISNARSFSQDLISSARTYVRDGEHVARTSKWMGERDFYPQAESVIISSQPRKIVDLGAGTCGLLIRCLRKLPNAQGIGIDVNGDACSKARVIIKEAELDDRLSVIEASIQSLIYNSSALEGADIIHAGFVFHDLMPDQEEMLDVLLKICHEKAPNGRLVVVEAVPYAQAPGEHAFSAAFTFLHNHFMGRQLLTEDEWKTKLSMAGYIVEVNHLGISGGRIFIGRSA